MLMVLNMKGKNEIIDFERSIVDSFPSLFVLVLIVFLLLIFVVLVLLLISLF